MIRIGTAGWSYPSGDGRWTGIFYPPGERAEALEFYARFFNTVEINNSFYRPLAPRVAQAWARKTPPDFRFTVKLYQKFTHPRMFEEATGSQAALRPEDFAQFSDGLAPLREAGKLGAVLAQFPPSFKRDSEALAHVAELAERFGSYGLTVELRHHSWTVDPTAAQRMQALGISWVHIDEPRFPSSVGQVPNTGPMAYFRFHGRNARDWWRGDRDARYNYLYSPREQADLARQIVAVAGRAGDTYALYNNHYRAKAVVNALQMRLLLGQEVSAEIPSRLIQEYPDLAQLLAREATERQGA